LNDAFFAVKMRTVNKLQARCGDILVMTKYRIQYRHTVNSKSDHPLKPFSPNGRRCEKHFEDNYCSRWGRVLEYWRNEMRDQKWTDERIEKALEKSGRMPMMLRCKARSKIERALLEENARLRQQGKETEKQRSTLSSILSSLSGH
jgi:hypothetical protein